MDTTIRLYRLHFLLAAYRVVEKLIELYKTDADKIKLFSEHEAILEEIKGENSYGYSLLFYFTFWLNVNRSFLLQ